MTGAGISQSSVFNPAPGIRHRTGKSAGCQSRTLSKQREECEVSHKKYMTGIILAVFNFLIRRALFWGFGFIEMKSVMRGGR